MSFEEFIADVCKRLRVDMGSIRNPEGDVHPALFHYHDGESIMRLKIPKSSFSSRSSKDILMGSLATVAFFIKPVFCGFETTTYRVDRGDLEPGEPTPTRPSTHCKRVECVHVLFFSHDETQLWESVITRDRRPERGRRNPPVFGPWTRADMGGVLEGAIVDPLQAVMRR